MTPSYSNLYIVNSRELGEYLQFRPEGARHVDGTIGFLSQTSSSKLELSCAADGVGKWLISIASNPGEELVPGKELVIYQRYPDSVLYEDLFRIRIPSYNSFEKTGERPRW